MYRIRIILGVLVLVVGVAYIAFTQSSNKSQKVKEKKENKVFSKTSKEKVSLSNKEWKEVLPEEVYKIAREKGTELPYTGKYLKNKEKGLYRCRACGAALFTSHAKFDSGCGWPSFYEPVSKASLIYKKDLSHGMVRTEILCGRCESHLGHVFEDAPQTPTGLRYCLNSIILDFEKAEDKEDKKEEAKSEK